MYVTLRQEVARDQAIDEHPLGRVPSPAFGAGGTGFCQPEAGALVDVVAREPSGEGCRVVCVDECDRAWPRREGLHRVGVDSFEIEDRDVHPGDPVIAQRIGEGALHGAEVLSDERGVVAPRLEAAQGDQLFGSVADVRALCGRHAVGYPPKSGKSHRVIEPESGRVAQQVAERAVGDRVARSPLPFGIEGPRTPVLAGAEEHVGRGTDRHSIGERLGVGPRVEAVRTAPDRKVQHDPGT